MQPTEEGVLEVTRDQGPLSGRLPDGSAGFADWVRPHLAVLSAIAVREVGPDAAEDVVQDTLVRSWSRISTFAPERGSPRAWLIAILLDRCRRLRVRTRTAVELTDAGREVLGVDESLDVEAAVAALPRRQRQVVVLHYLADLPVNEVADVLRISVGTVKSSLSDARANLRSALTAEAEEQ